MKVFVSGGLHEGNMKELCEAGAEGFGVGPALSNAPMIDLAMDIVEIDGGLCAKRGKMGGRKQVWRYEKCLTDLVLLFDKPKPKCPSCGGSTEPLLKPLVKNGKIVAKLPKPNEIRQFVLDQLERLCLEESLGKT